VAAVIGVAVIAGDMPAHAQTGTIAPLSRFEGTWYQVASYGSKWDERCARDTTLTVTGRSRSDAVVRSQCHTRSAIRTRTGRLVAQGDEGRWRTRFAPAVFTWVPAAWGDFWVLGHDDALTWFVVGERDHERLAVLSRAIALDEAAMAQAMAMARRAGFDIGRLRRVEHDPDGWRSAR
jgi:apolipoprotein D and lipocalin family protein